MGVNLHRSAKQTCSDKSDLSDRTATPRSPNFEGGGGEAPDTLGWAPKIKAS